MTYEYMLLDLYKEDTERARKTFLKQLNILGKAGWRVVPAQISTVLLLEREIAPQPKKGGR